MPQPAVHKSKDKKRKGAAGAEYAYKRSLQDLDEALNKEEEIIFGRITKKLRYDHFNASIYIPSKKNTLEIQVNVPYKNTDRLKTDVGNYVVVVQEGKRYEVFLTLSDDDVRSRKNRIHDSLHRQSVNNSTPDDCGIEFTNEDDEQETSQDNTEEKKSKKDKTSKHKERILIDGTEEEDDDVDVDNI